MSTDTALIVGFTQALWAHRCCPCVACLDLALERIGAEGSFPLADDALLLPLRSDDSQDLIEADHFLAWDELLGAR